MPAPLKYIFAETEAEPAISNFVLGDAIPIPIFPVEIVVPVPSSVVP